VVGRVEGKVAFITGAARGQGRSHAVRLAEEGADIIAVDICEGLSSESYAPATEADLADTVTAVEALGRRMIAGQIDVRDMERLDAFVGDAVKKFGRLDIVSANAGVGSGSHLTHEMTDATWQETIGINLTGVWHTVKAAVPHLIAGASGGSIILTSSVAGLKGVPHFGHYAASKHGVVGLMRSLALELAPYSIRVNSIHPGNVDTPMLMNDTMYKLFSPDIDNPNQDDFAKVSRTLIALPIAWLDAIDISNALLFLASDEARYITGAALPVDGGMTIK
jgi:SDR family mycofactocin-dependent oxidoreductase